MASNSRYQRNSPTLGNCADLDATDKQDGYLVGWDESNSVHKYIAPGGLDPATEARIDNLETRYARITRFESIGTNTSGTLTIPTNETVVLDDFGGTFDAIVTHFVSGKPDWTPVVDTNGTLVSTTFNTNGAYSLSAAASTTNNCVVFRTQVEAKNLVYDAGVIGPYSMDPAHTQLSLLNSDSNYQHLTQTQVSQIATSASNITSLQLSIDATSRCGITAWTGAATNYYSWTPGAPGTLTILKGLEGYIGYSKITAAAGQSITIDRDSRPIIYFDSNGIIQQVPYTAFDTVVESSIPIFAPIHDIDGVFFSIRKDYAYTLDTGARVLNFNLLGTVICPQPTCAILSRYGTGTGASATDRMVNLSAGEITDASIIETWDAVTTGCVVNHTYLNASNYCVRHSQSAQFPMVYILNGVATAITSGYYSVSRVFITKSDLNTEPPQFISEIDTAQYATLAAAEAAIGANTVSGLSLVSNELCQVGFVVVQNNLSGGQVIETIPLRKTAVGYLGVGYAPDAKIVATTTAQFVSPSILSGTEATVQSALVKLGEAASPYISAYTKDATGFVDPENIGRSYSASNRTITLTHSSGKIQYLFRDRLVELTSPWVSSAHTADTNSWFLTSTDGTNFSWSTTPWNFYDVQVARACYTGTTHVGLAEVHGLMPWQDHQQAHDTINTYRRSGGAVSGVVTGSTTAADRRPLIALTVVKDEDLITNNPALNTNSYTIISLTGATPGALSVTTGATDIVPLSGTQPFYNQNNAGTWQQTLLPNNSHMNVWVVAVPVTDDAGSQSYRYCLIQGQNQGTLASIQSLASTSLEMRTFTSVFVEFVFIHRFVVKFSSGNWTIEVSESITGTQASQISSSTSGLTSVQVDATHLSGNGTISSPLTITSNVATALNLGPITATLTEKTSLIDTDMVPMMDAGASNATKKVSAATLLKPLLTNVKSSNATRIPYSDGTNLTNSSNLTFDTNSNLSSLTMTVTSTNVPTTTQVVNVNQIGPVINGATGKTTPVDADLVGISDSAASGVLKKLTWANLKATLIATAMTWTGKQTFDGGAAIKGATSAVAAGYVGEIKNEIRDSVVLELTSGVWNDGTSPLSLTPGVWEVTGSMRFLASGGQPLTQAILSMGTASGSSTTGRVSYAMDSIYSSSVPSGSVITITLPVVILTVTSTTNWYMKVQATCAAAPVAITDGHFKARRIL